MNRCAIVADSILTSAGVTGDAVVIEDGRIVEVTHRSRLPADIATEHHAGATIVPPMIDSHLHPLGYAALISGTSVKTAGSVAELGERLREAASRLPASRAVMAQRLDDTVLGRMPTRHDLDAALADRPVIAYRYCGHVAVVNTIALELAGIGPDTPDPTGGSFDRDSGGVPTGVLRETAVQIVGPALEPLVTAPDDESIVAALEGLVAVGLSRVAGIVNTGDPIWCGVGAEFDTLCRLAEDVPLDIDVLVIADHVDELRRAAERIGQAGGRLRFWGWKHFADGSLGGHTAAMWAPFADGTDTTGTLRLDSGALTMTQAALELGGVSAIHAIGDRAVDLVIDVFERAIGQRADPNRLRVEHASVVSDSALDRLAASGVIASVQPAFVSSEAEWVPQRVGPDRPAYRFADMAAGGVRMLGGSDCPVEPPNPLAGLASAVNRPGWSDDQHLTVKEAIGLFTSAPAEHLGLPPPLTPGAPADLVLVDGTVGAFDARVRAVLEKGRWRELRPAEWPG